MLRTSQIVVQAMKQFSNSSIIFVCAILTATVTAFKEFYSFESHYGGKIIAIEDVEVDKEGQYALIRIKPLSDRTIATQNLHDFNSSFTAVRNNGIRRCHIFKNRHTLDEMMDMYKTAINRDGFYDITQTFTCTSHIVIPKQDMYIFGKRISDFCKGDEVVFSDRKFFTKRNRSIRSIPEASMTCGVCIGGCRDRPI